MKSDFVIFLVCITLIQIILVKVSSTCAVIRKENINDIRLLQKYREVSSLQLKKGVEIFFPRNLQGWLTKAGLRDEYSNKENINGTEICTNRIVARALGSIDATFSTALIADPEIASAATSARPAIVNGTIHLARSLCSALKLATEKKTPATAAKFQAIIDKEVPAAAAWNLQFFNAIGMNRELQPEVNSLMKEAEGRSTNVLAGAFTEMFIGLQKLASLDLQVEESEEIASIMNTFRESASSKYVANAGEILDVSETLVITPSTTGSGYGVHSSANKDGTMAIQCGPHNVTEMARSQIRKGYFTWVNTIQLLLHKTLDKSSSISQNDRSVSGTAREETSAAFISTIAAAMDAVSKINPQCSSKIQAKRDAAVKKMQQIINNVYDSIDSIRLDPGKALAQLKALESETISGAPGVVVDIFEGISNCIPRSVDTGLQTSIQSKREKSIIKFAELFQIIFTAIKLRTVEISSGIQAEGKAPVIPLKDTQAQASASGKTSMQIIVDVILSILEASTNEQFDKASSLSAIQVYSEKLLFKIEKGVNLIFSKIASGKDVAEDSLSNIITSGHAVTSAAYMIALRNLFCESQIPGPRTIWVNGKEAFDAVQQVVDNKYDVLYKAIGKEACELLPKLESVEAKVNGYHAKFLSVLFDENRRRSNSDVQMESAITQAQESSVSSIKAAIAPGFKAVETLARSNCPSSRTESSNILSLFRSNYNTVLPTLDSFISDMTHGVRSTAPISVNNIFQQVHAMTSQIQSSLNLPPLVPIQSSNNFWTPITLFQPPTIL